MKRKILAALLALGCLTGAPVAFADHEHTLAEVTQIEREYARLNDGEMISDAQLSYYLDRAEDGWSMGQIMSDIASASRRFDDTPWQPESGWRADEVVCSSVDRQYRECRIPFNGTAMVTFQISATPCIEGTSWGQKPGAVWVRNGCRAEFGVRTNTVPPPVPVPPPVTDRRVVVCQSFQGKYRECRTGFRGRAILSRQLNNSTSCVAGRTWGQREGVVWVRRGCRAQFTAVTRPGAGGVWDPNYAVTCASSDRNRVRCRWNTRYGRPRLDRQLSQTACVEGRTWGYEQADIWVSNGCRGRFVSTQTRGWDDGRADNGWIRDDNYNVVCNSTGNGRTVCTWDDRYGTPRMSQQLSQSACVEGRDWGYDRGGQLWVTSGCRARFGYR